MPSVGSTCVTWQNIGLKSGIFFKIKHLIPFDIIKLLYHSIFSPFFYYGDVVWHVTSECFMNPVSVQQEKVIRAFAFNDYFSLSEPLFLKLGLLKLDDIFKLQLTSSVYAYINKLAPAVFGNYFNHTSNIHDYSTRQADRVDIFVVMKNTLQYGIKSVRYAGTKS